MHTPYQQVSMISLQQSPFSERSFHVSGRSTRSPPAPWKDQRGFWRKIFPLKIQFFPLEQEPFQKKDPSKHHFSGDMLVFGWLRDVADIRFRSGFPTKVIILGPGGDVCVLVGGVSRRCTVLEGISFKTVRIPQVIRAEKYDFHCTCTF